MTLTFKIKVQFCSMDAHQANPAEHSVQDISKLLLHYIATYGNKWCYFNKAATFCLNALVLGHYVIVVHMRSRSFMEENGPISVISNCYVLT